jgi:hypothetical protein
VPFGLLSVSVQTGAPVVQTILPTRHGLPVTAQSMPATQLSQLPLWQTLSTSQTVPFACRSVSSMHDRTPSMQTNCPLWHALVGTHEPPATQVGASVLPPSGLVLPPVPTVPLTPPPVPTVPAAPPRPPMPAAPPPIPPV